MVTRRQKRSGLKKYARQAVRQRTPESAETVRSMRREYIPGFRNRKAMKGAPKMLPPGWFSK